MGIVVEISVRLSRNSCLFSVNPNFELRVIVHLFTETSFLFLSFDILLVSELRFSYASVRIHVCFFYIRNAGSDWPKNKKLLRNNPRLRFGKLRNLRLRIKQFYGRIYNIENSVIFWNDVNSSHVIFLGEMFY